MAQLNTFLKTLPQQSFQPDEVILAKGQIPTCLYIPLRGIVKVHEIDKYGVERRILSVQKFEPLPSGWMAEPHKPVTYVYTAFTKVKCALMDHATLMKLSQTSPKVLLELLALTDKRLFYAKERIEMLVQGKAEDKVLYLLKYLNERASKPTNQKGKNTFTIKMTQKEIGESLGLTRETTSRIIRELTAEGVLETGPRQQLTVVESKLFSLL